MGIKMWKILKGMFSTALFCGYFYVLFVSLVCGFSMSGIESRWDALKVLVCAFLMAAGLPGVIWYQHHRIEKLEKELEELQHF